MTVWSIAAKPNRHRTSAPVDQARHIAITTLLEGCLTGRDKQVVISIASA